MIAPALPATSCTIVDGRAAADLAVDAVVLGRDRALDDAGRTCRRCAAIACVERRLGLVAGGREQRLVIVERDRGRGSARRSPGATCAAATRCSRCTPGTAARSPTASAPCSPPRRPCGGRETGRRPRPPACTPSGSRGAEGDRQSNGMAGTVMARTPCFRRRGTVVRKRVSNKGAARNGAKTGLFCAPRRRGARTRCRVSAVRALPPVRRTRS